jgi:Domain of unknown function (DUF4412)
VNHVERSISVNRLKGGFLALLFLPLVAAAQYEGELDMKMTMGTEAMGTGRMLVSKAGARSEMTIQIPEKQRHEGMGSSVKMTTIFKASDPDTVTMLNDEARTYSVMDLKKAREMAPRGGSEETYTVKKLGSETVAGFACQDVVITSSKGNEVEACVTKDVTGSSAWSAMARRGGSGSGLMKALRDAGLEGFPVKMKMSAKGRDDRPVMWELVKAEKRSIPASMFEVPAGYTKEETPMGAMMNPEMRQKMQEALDKMTPEQRRQFEEMMKARSGGQ